jgi:tetratricopeptide (TPR) repeat protein
VEKNKGLWILAIYFFLAIYLLPMFPHGGSANELTRWATAASLVEKGTFEISWTEDLIGKNVDTARVGDKTYSNKPPGTAVLAAPFYALTRIFVGAPDASNIRISWFVMRLFLSTLPLLFLGFWLYGRDSDELSIAALLFGTPLFLYSLLFFSHVLVAVLIYFAFRLLYDTERIFLRNCVLAGFLSGLAVTCEFTAVIPVLVFGVGLFFADRRNQHRLQNLFIFALGGAPFAILLLVYNYAIFGSPFALSYAYESFPEWAEVAGQGVFGIGFPTLSNIYLLLISPSRGLFFYAPILFLPIVAFFTSRERRTLRHRVKIAAIVVSILVLCGHGAAHGGWAFGARYLVFVLPLFLDSFFDGEIYELSNIWQGVLFTISFLLCTLPALTFPFAPPEFKYPHNNFWGALLFYENWFTPNLANVFGLSSSVWTILPALILLFAVLFIVRRCVRRPGRFTAGIFAGLILVGVYLALPNLDNPENEFRRATIAERYFKPANRLEIFKATTNWQILQRVNNFEWTIADIRAYAPNDFPYLATRDFKPSPTAELRKVLELQNQNKLPEAETILQKGKEAFPFARCEFGANLAVIYYTTDRKDLALTELESVQNLVNPASRPDCQRSQFLLGSLYREKGETDKANQTFQKFLTNTQNSNDSEIKNFRQQIGVK